MIATTEQIQQGLAKYLDSHLVPNLRGTSRILVGAGAALAIKRLPVMIESYKDNQLVSMLGLISESGVDIDAIGNELLPRMEEDKLEVNLPGVNIKLDKKDIEEILKCIKES